MKHSRSQGDSPLTEAWDLMPPRTHASVLKRGRERGTSIRPLHRNEQDVWTQLCTSQTPLEPKSSTATMSRPTYSIGPDKIYGCLCAGLPTYLCTSTDLYLPVRLTAGLVCQCLCMIMFDYVSRCVYINEIEILICMCWYSHACVWVCVCIRLFVRMCVYMMEEEKGGVWKTSLAQSCCSLNLCSCQRKLWSEESANRAWGMSPETRIIWNPETTAGRHLRGPLLKGRQRPWVRATLPPGSSH